MKNYSPGPAPHPSKILNKGQSPEFHDTKQSWSQGELVPLALASSGVATGQLLLNDRTKELRRAQLGAQSADPA